MCSLQFAAQVENYKINKSTSTTYDEEKIKDLIEMIDIHLGTYK